jgi:hypothetical protein
VVFALRVPGLPGHRVNLAVVPDNRFLVAAGPKLLSFLVALFTG